jgi:hypothetical protein
LIEELVLANHISANEGVLHGYGHPLVGQARRRSFGRTASVYNLLSQCERFGLTTEAARNEIEQLVPTLKTWRDHFRACGVSAKDTDYIAPAFLPECFFFEKTPENFTPG